MKGRSKYEIVIRYILGLIMVAYGLIKIFQIQFRLPPSSYEIPLGHLDGITLTWAFLGYNSWFAFLLGIFEFLSGVLLLFKSTKLMGGILLLPTLIAIFLINNAFGFLTYMRIFTGFLLLLNILLLANHLNILKLIVKKIVCTQPKNPQIELIFNFTLISIVIFLVVFYLL